MRSYISWVLSFATVALTAKHNVNVGRTGLTFEPNQLYNIEIGDILNFHFYSNNHSVAESTFDKPCKPKSDDSNNKPIYSGFIPVDDGVAKRMWSMTANTTEPIWLYCSQGERQHCRQGLSMVINPRNDSDQNLEAYMSNAKDANVTSPDEVFGGLLIDDDGGQAGNGSQARPTTSLTANVTVTAIATATVKPTSGVASSFDGFLCMVIPWGSLAIVFLVTL